MKPLNRAAQLKGKAVTVAWEGQRRRCRSKWLSAIKQGREVRLKALRGKLPREYAWLRQNDSEWLEGHKPRSYRRKLSTISVDWKRRDTDYSVAVRAAAVRLKVAPGHPVQVTRTAIGRAVGAISLLRQKLHNMPITSQVLAGAVETREEYAVRRVSWAAGLYLHEKILPREWQLVLRASVYRVRDIPAVKCAIAEALIMLGTELGLMKKGRNPKMLTSSLR